MNALNPTALWQLEAAEMAIAGDELIVDSFAGGGGASTGIEMALGRSPDFAINHDPEALALHRANHPDTVHLSKNIYKVDPLDVVGRSKVGLLWASPDCKHFSKAKGGKPVKREIRDLAWTVVLWAERVRPRVIILENVEEFQTWGPLIETEKGVMPCPERKGETFNLWIAALRKHGYRVEWRELRACDYGAPTTRKRLFLIARCDGRPIVWPAATHGAPHDQEVIAGRRMPWVTAAEIIDWAEPCPSIFDSSEEIMARHGVRAVRPLAKNTMARIAKGVKRYVIDAAKPFVIKFQTGAVGSDIDAPLPTVTANSFIKKPGGRAPLGVVVPHLTSAQQGGSHRSVDEPHRTITASDKDQNQVVAASLVQTGYGERDGQEPRALDPGQPLGTVVAGGVKHAAVAAFLAQHNTDMVGHHPAEPVSTIVQKGCTQAVVSAGLMNMKGEDRASWPVEGGTSTQTAGGQHIAEVRAFLLKYYGNEEEGHDPGNPLGTVTTRDRFGLVMVDGEPYQITDIGMRMLTPRELFKAQGFPADYQIESGDFDGEHRALTKTAQVRMCGNSVCPPIAAALVGANCADLAVMREAAE